MKVIILTGKFGMGHIKTAEAIKEKIILQNKDCEVLIVDFFDYLNPSFGKVCYRTFNFMVNNFSHIYNTINIISTHFCTIPLKNYIYKRIDELIIENNCDLVISTFPTCSQYISAYKEQKHSKIKLFTYITDIAIHDEWIAKNVDLYFVGSNVTKNILLSKGIEEKKIIISGIPVLNEFNNKKEYKISNKRNILIMGGGLGLIPNINKIIDNLSNDKTINLTIITGKNYKLRNRLIKKYPDITILGYVDNVANYLKDADIIITKSGGITTFEAINMGTPLLILRPFINSEIGNAKFIEENNIGKVLWSKNDNIEDNIELLLKNKSGLKIMKKNMIKLKKVFKDSCPLSYYND